MCENCVGDWVEEKEKWHMFFQRFGEINELTVRNAWLKVKFKRRAAALKVFRQVDGSGQPGVNAPKIRVNPWKFKPVKYRTDIIPKPTRWPQPSCCVFLVR